jgi:hypothetical protein
MKVPRLRVAGPAGGIPISILLQVIAKSREVSRWRFWWWSLPPPDA